MVVGALIFLLGMAIPIILIALALLADLAYAMWTFSRKAREYGPIRHARSFTMAHVGHRHQAAFG